MGKIPISCPVVGSRQMEVEIGFKYVPALQNLRTCTGNLGENITLSFDTTQFKEVISNSGNLQSNIEPLCIKHINLEVLVSQVPIYESLTDELFSYFHLRTLLVRVNQDVLNCNFIQVLLDELKRQNRDRTKRYKCSNYMCWRYALKSFEILESTTTTKQGAHQISLEFLWHLP
ncbi:hypothetical protein HAX54_040292 [Datura stramonium]|uniref:Uncharacterized protein n=1 Tax=Datura stramonium TaxID=4076 RepID=A0ABS8VNQ5_DATST|nr:hypothetical protein [Datura stramonium]